MLREPHRMFEPNRLKTRSCYTVAFVVPPDGSALRHVLHAYRELALVVCVADAGGALIDVRDLLQDLGGALPVGADVSLHSTRTGSRSFVGSMLMQPPITQSMSMHTVVPESLNELRIE